MEKELFIRVGSKNYYNTLRNTPLLDKNQLVFVEETGEIIADGKSYGGNEAITIVPLYDETELTAYVKNYYRFNSPVNTLNINLMIPTETHKLQSLVLFFTTGDAPQITFNAGYDIKYFKGYSIEPNTTYEINLMFNGNKWIVAHGIID